MDWTVDDLQKLSQCFVNTLSPYPAPRREAEQTLSLASSRPNYSLALLRLVSDSTIPEQVRQSAAVYFKNYLRLRWSPSPDDDHTDAPPLPVPEKDQIKSLLLPLLLSSPSLIQSQLSESLSLIGKHDFPKLWPSLLPSLVDNLRTFSLSRPPDYPSINGILTSANSLFKKFRYQYKTDDLLRELKACLDAFSPPLLEIFLQTARLIDEVSKGSNLGLDLRSLFESQRLCCRIFYSLNFQELPEFFEDHMAEWMGEFEKYLTSRYPVIEDGGNPAAGTAVVDELRAAVCENISLYMEKNEEEFQPYLGRFASAVWGLLGDITQNPSRDRLAINAIKFLTTVSTSVHHTLFAVEGGIRHICERVVKPNVLLSEEDEELFEMNYVEFIRRDMEGSDLDTRRRVACELLKGISTNYKAEVTRIVSSQIQELLTSFSSNPLANWKNKDCAIFLVVSLSTRKSISGGGVAFTDLVDVQSFFSSVIVPELQSRDVNDFPILKAGALKFFTLFRHQIPKDVALQFISDLVRFMTAASCVVHSYAANCIEKLLLVKEEDGKARYNSSDIVPVLPAMMNNLFGALRLAESGENQYVMKCIMRVLGRADINPQIAGSIISGLTTILGEVCKNPKNPVFNHYLFESVAVLVRRSCEADGSLISSFEISLFPILQTILANDVTEFFPYAFQLLAQLVDLNRPPIPATYMPIFQILLSPDLWGKRSNVPALVQLLQSFLQKSPHELSQGGRLIQVLDIFNGLMKSTSTEEQGFFVLITIFENLEYGLIAPHVAHIWYALFDRLQKRQTTKFVKSLLIFMSLFLVKHGSADLVDSMNSVQPSIFSMILEQIWIPNLKLITGPIEIKLTAVASTRLLCESPFLLDAAASRYWGRMLDSILTLLSRPEEERVDEEPEVPDIAETVGYTATFVSLHHAGKKEEDPLKDIRDPRESLVSSLARLSAISPGKYPQIISANVEPVNQAALLQLCNTFNCPIV